jgi:hypothetical protein
VILLLMLGVAMFVLGLAATVLSDPVSDFGPMIVGALVSFTGLALVVVALVAVS